MPHGPSTSSGHFACSSAFEADSPTIGLVPQSLRATRAPWLHGDREPTQAPAARQPHRPHPTPAQRALLPRYVTLSDAHIHVPTTLDGLMHARKVLLSTRVLGFDTETQPGWAMRRLDEGPHLLQLATSTDAWLLPLDQSAPLQLAREVMASPHIHKVGFGLDSDLRELPKRLGTPLRHVADLDARFERFGYGKNLGVCGAVAVVLGQHFDKDKRISVSKWANRPLSPAQRRYAANDAHAPAVLWTHLPHWEAHSANA